MANIVCFGEVLVGTDNDGQEIKAFMEQRGLTTTYIQEPKILKASNVIVSLDHEGAASYNIKQPCAWDEIIHEEDMHYAVSCSDAFIFGSLASRSKVTKGKNGAVFFDGGSIFSHKGYPVDLVDTVGAGDSFMGALIHQVLRKESIENALSFACAVGVVVARSEGGKPIITNQDIQTFILNSQ